MGIASRAVGTTGGYVSESRAPQPEETKARHAFPVPSGNFPGVLALHRVPPLHIGRSAGDACGIRSLGGSAQRFSTLHEAEDAISRCNWDLKIEGTLLPKSVDRRRIISPVRQRKARPLAWRLVLYGALSTTRAFGEHRARKHAVYALRFVGPQTQQRHMFRGPRTPHWRGIGGLGHSMQRCLGVVAPALGLSRRWAPVHEGHTAQEHVV